MSSFHTKYRPETLDEVLGQAAVVKSLKRVAKDNRARTFLFVGPAGTGKTTLARILAKLLGATSPTNLIEHDAASKSGADDMRELNGQLQYRAIGGSPIKFVIIDECHKLSSAAWTVLLKPTEEPPQHVYYSFCTTELGKIPKAIITRCLRYDLKPVKEEAILEILIKAVDGEKLTIDDDVLEAIAENSGGSPRQALVYLEECVGLPLAEARNLMRAAGQTKEIVDLCRWLVAGKGLSWVEAAKYLKALEGLEGESCRIQITNYLGSVLLNQKNEKAASNILRLIEAFKTPYYASDKLVPLYYSVGLAIGLDQ